MMEISQNMDLKELPTDEELMLSIAEELDKDVDKLSSPGKSINKSHLSITNKCNFDFFLQILNLIRSIWNYKMVWSWVTLMIQ